MGNEDDSWPAVRNAAGAAAGRVDILPVARADGDRTLKAIHVTRGSAMGAIAYWSGGLLVDHGWLRILGGGGGGHVRLARDLASWNFMGGDPKKPRLAGALLVADDVSGGFCAINGGGLDGPPGHVFYFAPDSLAWEDCWPSYSAFLSWAFTGDLAKFYEQTRWHGWEADVARMSGDQGVSFYPPLFTKESKPIDKASRRVVPIAELWSFGLDMARKLGAR